MLKTEQGFILNRYWLDTHTNRKHTLVFWVKSCHGIHQLCFTDQASVFFIRQSDLENALNLLEKKLPRQSWYVRPINLKSFDQQPASAFYFNQQRTLYFARKLLQDSNIYPLESDIQPTDRFMMERNLRGGISFTGEQRQHQQYSEIINPKITAIETTVPLTIASIDIETHISTGELLSIAMIFSSTNAPDVVDNKVWMIGKPLDNPTLNYLHMVNNETDLLSAFIDFFKQQDPDIIIGWNVINFDLRFLQQKCEQLNISLNLGRADQPLDWRQSRNDSDHFTLVLPGRCVLDGIDTLKSATYNFESFSLNHVASELLGKQKLIEDSDNKASEIIRQFNEDKLALARYNLDDCQLVWDIFQKADLINFSLQRAQLTGLAMDRFGGSVASFDNRYLPRLHRSGYVAPNIPLQPENVGSPGGYVMDSYPGLYDHVLVLDFKSLYPSIIRTFKIDPLALVEGLQQEANTAIKDQQETSISNKHSLIAGFNGAVFDKSKAILPELIKELWQARDVAKSQNNAPMSQAIKILMNSFYGVLGTPGCRFFDFRLPSSITLRGHQILYTTKDVIEAKGFKVIYGDTDSVFVWLKGYHRNIAPESIQGIGQELAQQLNQWWQKTLKNEHQIDSFLEIEFETHFKRFIMPTIRGSEKGSKKRYAGLKSLPNKQTALIFKGLETVRTDWTQAARQFQQSLYQKVFDEQDYHDLILDTVNAIKSGQKDELLIYRKRIRRKLSDYKKNIPPHVQAAKMAESDRAARGLTSKYAKGGWIEYYLTTQGPQAIESRNAPLDYDLYLERQIKPIADGILHFLGQTFDDITSQQIDLF